MTALDPTSANDIRARFGGEYEGCALTVRERAKSGILKVDASLVPSDC